MDNRRHHSHASQHAPPQSSTPHTPHQILGPYSPAVENAIETDDLTVVEGIAGHAQGEIIVVEGRVLNRSGDTVEGARLVIWQANSFGRYAHPNDRNPAPLDENFVGSAEIISVPAVNIASGL